MTSTWTLLLAAFGLALVLEGLPYFISPPMVRRYLAAISTMGDSALRLTGLVMIVVGLAVAYVATH